jgi:hypothetical protein
VDLVDATSKGLQRVDAGPDDELVEVPSLL